MLILFMALIRVSNASPAQSFINDSTWHSTKEQALQYLETIKQLDTSHYWPNVAPDLFLENLKTFVTSPLKFYEGRSTNFCAYSALTYIPLYYDPLGFCKIMIRLYKTGKTRVGKVFLHPSFPVRQEAGALKYKGALDISPVGQMWFLSLANHFKGYINFFNRRFNKGDENTLWAATNFAKFNRMLRRLFPIHVHEKGSDLIRPWIDDLYEFIHEKSRNNIVFLYVNYRLLYIRDHVKVHIGIPTHFIHLLDIQQSENEMIDLFYSDDGIETFQQVSPGLLRKVVFGITWCSPVKK